MQKMWLDVFGRRILAEYRSDRWWLYLVGNEGKRRPFTEVEVPPNVASAQSLLRFLDDQLHELATPRHPAVRRVDNTQA